MGVPTQSVAYRTLQDDPEIGVPARWAGPIVWELSMRSLDASRDPSQLAAVSAAAFATWASQPCVTLPTTFSGLTDQPAAPADDRNTLMFVTSGWADAGLPPNRGAVTDIRLARDSDGILRIVEADIYVNFDDFVFSLDRTAPGTLDLQAVLTHEVGHVLGLLHTCEHEQPSVAPRCDEVPDASDAALYPDYLGTRARSLGADDLMGICALYRREPGCEPSCDAGEICLAGRCQPDPCVGGRCDPCETDGSCAMTPCDDAGRCARGACAVIGGLSGYCIEEGTFGAACESAYDCESLRCLQSSVYGRFCTEACSELVECAVGYRCERVGNHSVCVPPPATQSCGVGHGASGSMRQRALATLALITLIVSRRRRSQGNSR